jgi:hypothetical protein
VSKLPYVISDPGHAWLAVRTADVVAAGITPSVFSYISRGGNVTYLEEDCDVALYVEATGLDCQGLRVTYYNNEWPGRNYPSYPQEVA